MNKFEMPVVSAVSFAQFEAIACITGEAGFVNPSNVVEE